MRGNTGIKSSSDVVHNRMMLVKKFKAFGFHPAEVHEMLRDDHNIDVSLKTIENDFKELNSGKYSESYLDLLLDVNYPILYETSLNAMAEDLDALKAIADTTDNMQLKAKCLIAHTKLHMNVLDTLHKGEVIREMKKLSTKAKILVREVMMQDSMIKNRGNIELKKNSDELAKKTLIFDEDLHLLEEKIESETTPESLTTVDNIEE